MANPIGVTFLPSQEAQDMGPQQAGLETDLGQALKILSLRLPKRPAFHGLAPPSLLQSRGSGALPPSMPGSAPGGGGMPNIGMPATDMGGGPSGGSNPMEAVIRAILGTMGGDMGRSSLPPQIIPGGAEDVRVKYDGPDTPMPDLSGARRPSDTGVPTGGMAQPRPLTDLPADGGASGYQDFLGSQRGLRRRF